MKMKDNYDNNVIVIKLIPNKTPRKAQRESPGSQRRERERHRDRDRDRGRGRHVTSKTVVRPPGGY